MIDPTNPNYNNKPGSSQRPNFDYILSEDDFIPYVSIITPFYNTDEVFYDTAKSVLNQSFQQFEWLIINDGTDNQSSIEILNKFRDKDRRIKIVDHDNNKGLSAARNTGFKLAKAKYVLQIDSDDLLEETAVEKWLWFLESFPGYSFCKGFSIGFGAEEYLWDNGFIDGRVFLDKNLTDATCLVEKSIHDKVGGYDENLKDGLEDWDFWLKCANSGFWGSNVPEYLNWYRRRKDHTDRWKNINSSIENRDIIETFRRKYPELWNGSFPTILSSEKTTGDNSPDISHFKNILKKNKHRVIFLITSLDNDFENVISYNFTKQLINANCELSLITIGQSNINRLSEISNLTPDVFVLPNFLRIRDYPKFLLYFLISRQIDLLLFFNCSGIYSLIPFIKEATPNTKLIPIISDKDVYLKNSINELQKYNDHLDLIYLLTTNSKGTELINKIGVNSINCQEIVDTEYWNSNAQQRQVVRNELNVDFNDTVLISCFHEGTHKIKPRVLLGVIIELAKKFQNITFIIAGNGINWEWFNHHLINNNIEDRCRRIWITNDKIIRRLFSAADIFFSPFETQNEELLILKAMSSKLCVVGTKNICLDNISENNPGRFIKPSNDMDEIKQFTSIIEDLINNSAVISQIGNESKIKINNKYSIENVSNPVLKFIKDNFDETSEFKSYIDNIPNDIKYSEINKLDNELLSDIQKNKLRNVLTNDALIEEAYKQNLVLNKLNDECQENVKYNKELIEGIEFWQKNADTNVKKLSELRSNIFVRLLIKVGLIKNIF